MPQATPKKRLIMLKETQYEHSRVLQDKADQYTHEHFSPLFWKKHGLVIGSAQGRGTTWFVKSGSLELALRHYHRGGLFGKLVKDHYLFSGWARTRAYQEFNVLLHLKHAGVNVPTPIAAHIIKRNPFSYSADILTEKISQAKDLATLLQEGPIPKDTYKKIGQEIAKMHNANVDHTDLNIRNILINNLNHVWIIDFDKCVIRKQGKWKSGNLHRLLRSFRKESADIYWQEEDWQTLINGYNKEISTL
ncbi:3-deoxy-D-manno-octulosonic acid kinase [Vibrio sp. M250220]|uniref:3-deoxy-D-manno-octulosonic acid kinase n=1 Tax=Vibrio sp. M250220 TaxID=3020894 RepID=UPI002F3E58F6